MKEIEFKIKGLMMDPLTNAPSSCSRRRRATRCSPYG